MGRHSRTARRKRLQSIQTGWGPPLLIAGLTFLAFLPALHGNFLSWDDARNFVGNPWYRGLGWDNLKWMWTTTLLGHYVPLSWMTLGLDYLLWGMNPAGYHLTNVLLHTANAVLLYFVSRRLFRAGRIGADSTGGDVAVASAFAALLFAVHPLRVESVAWVTERRDMLSLMFVLVSTIYFLRAAADQDQFRRWYALSLITFGCALLSKATAVMLPAALLVLNVYPLRRLGGPAGWWTDSARRVYRHLVPFFILSAAMGVLSVVALHSGAQLPLTGKIAVSAYCFVFYFWKSIAPINLSPLYPMPVRLDPTSWRFIASYVILIGVAFMTWSARRRWPAISAGIAVFAALVLPLLGMVQNGHQIAADRYTYLAAPGLALIAASVFVLPGRFRFAMPIGVAVVAALAICTWRQCAVWQNSEVLWSRVVQLDSTSAIGQNNVGEALAENGRADEAIAHYERAIQLSPTYADPYNNIGLELAQRGKVNEAIELYGKALAANPSFLQAEINWGNALCIAGKLDEGITHYAKAERINPAEAGVQYDWGLALEIQGKLPEAAERLARAVTLDPTASDAVQELAKVRARQSAGVRR